MGIFSSFKKMFSKNICPKESDLACLVFPYPTKQITLGSKIEVPKGYDVVLGHSGKVLDCLYEGIFELNMTSLPKCSQKLKLTKQDKKGRFKKKFKANVYYINKSDYAIDVQTFDKAELGNRASGIFTCGLSASISFKINDSTKFMEVMLNEYDYIKVGEAEKILKYLTSDMLVSILHKYNFAISAIVANNPIIAQNIKDELSRKYGKLGLVLTELSNVKYILPRKYQIKYEEKLKQAKNEQNVLQDKDNISQQENLQQTTQADVEQQKIEQTEVEQVENNQDEYIPFGNIQIETAEKVVPSDKTLQQNQVKETESTMQDEQPTQDSEFVDLNLEKIYKEDQTNGIKCLHCGYINPNSATYCEICENKLK